MKMELNEHGQPIGPRVEQWQSCLSPAREVMNGLYGRLEPLDPARHAAELFNANAADTDGRMWTYLPYGPFTSLAQYRSWMEATCLGSDPLFFAIVDASSGRAQGLTSYMRIIPEHGAIEIGHLSYSPALRRTPLATEAASLMLRHAFALGYRRVEWKCNAFNGASRAAARRFGFSFEGVFRQHVILKGCSRDTAWYAITDGDWPAIDTAHRRWLDPANFDAAGHQQLALSALTAPLRRAPPQD